MPRRHPWRRAVAAVAGLVLLLVAAPDAVAGPAGPAGTADRALPAGFRHGHVEVEGTRLHYVRGGSGPALVLLHGWPQTWQAWRPVLPALRAGRTVVAFDLPGLGDSAAPAGGYDKATTARRLHAATQQLGLGRVDLIGHDVGALVAYPWARDYPADVSRVIVIETALSGFGLEDLYSRSWHFLFNATPAPTPELLIDNDDVPVYLDRIFDFSSQHDTIDRQVYYRAYRDPADRTAGYEYYRAFATDNADNRAQAPAKPVTLPVLAMGAAFSFGPGVAASYRQVGTDVRQVVVPDSGHWVPEENPQFLVDCTRLFLGLPGAPAPTPALAGCAA
ncbi:alpha/beta fold hydrolase [Micromonospora sp. WMMD708]|uniref:alpha/beta fold hydrolase n=1 Tax=Micromonospora sp. WMMD708 TaxID=3403464 RepID=UPI003BF4FD49